MWSEFTDYGIHTVLVFLPLTVYGLLKWLARKSTGTARHMPVSGNERRQQDTWFKPLASPATDTGPSEILRQAMATPATPGEISISRWVARTQRVNRRFHAASPLPRESFPGGEQAEAGAPL
jgi:hypothetical protein